MITIIYGTRPEYIKILPICNELDKEKIQYKLIQFTQHTDLIKDAKYDIQITIDDISPNRIDNVTLNILDKADEWLKETSLLITQGDTITSYSAALAAFTRHIPIAHIEAGLRSFDINNPWPEEALRRQISSMATFHFCPTLQNSKNLIFEGIRGNRYIVGNTVLDTIDTTFIPQSNTILVTMHRRENLSLLDKWFKELNALARKYRKYKFIFPMHPNPEITKFKHLLPNIKIIKPLSREDLITEIKRSILIISDSGGIVEESNYLHRKIIITRKCTERSEALWSQNAAICRSPEYLLTSFKKNINRKLLDYIPCFGDGRSSERIVKILKEYLEKNSNG